MTVFCFKVGRLEQLLQQQINETSRLGEILKKEREAYEEALQQTNYPVSNNLSGELKLISELRRSLEEGIVQNNKLRAQLQEKISRSPNHGRHDGSDEVQRLHEKLEDSERWNLSLQNRLDALQPRARGVGESVSENIASSRSENNETNDKVRFFKRKSSPLDGIFSLLTCLTKYTHRMRFLTLLLVNIPIRTEPEANNCFSINIQVIT